MLQIECLYLLLEICISKEIVLYCCKYYQEVLIVVVVNSEEIVSSVVQSSGNRTIALLINKGHNFIISYFQCLVSKKCARRLSAVTRLGTVDTNLLRG